MYLFGEEHALIPSVIGFLSLSGVLVFLGLRSFEKKT
jgi:hypothetical protein